MIVFITGGTGSLGKAVVASLKAVGHQPRVLTRKLNVPGAIQGDLLEAESYAQELYSAQAVIHLAALTHTTTPDDYYKVNAYGTEVLVQACLRAQVRRFIYVSTRAVGKECGAYGDSKGMAEETVRQSGLDWTILRPGEIYMDVGYEAVGRMIESVRRGPVAFYVAHRSALLAPVHREDVVTAILATLGKNQTIGKSYVLAGPQEFTQGSFLRQLARLFSVRRIFVPLPLSSLRCASFVFSILRFKKPPFVPDQIPRMLCAKEHGIANAIRDLNYAPRDIKQGLFPTGTHRKSK